MERSRGQSVPSYLGWSIFTLICCCLPVGIAALICSCRVNDASSAGDSVRATEASRKAKILNIVGLVIGIIVIIIVVTFSLLKGKQH
uniref:Uncharacterized protein n=1 Tax=Erpetoichthys calabaricus TaxID=27687 RepID=A0A8C4SYM1_ERPCA